MATGGSTLHGVTDDQKRWLVFGIALNKVLVTQIRSFVEQEVQKEDGNLQTSHNIHTQSTSGRLKNWLTLLRYENINGNDALPRLPGGRYNYSLFDCQVTSHVDFAKLYVENHMAKFNAFDEHCDASAVLALLGKVPVFSPAVQSAANDVRQGRNAWAHCVFSDWDPVNYQQSFNEMERLVKSLGLTPAIERRLLAELRDWETKGTILCMNATVDPDLLKLVQQHVNTLKTDVEQLTFEVQQDWERVSQALKDISTSLEELEARVANVQHEQEVMKQEQSSLSTKVDAMQTDLETLKLLNKSQEDVQQRVAHVEKQLSSSCSQENPGDCSYEGPTNEGYQQFYSKVSVEISSCEGDVTFFAKRYDSDTRQWFFDDFDEWFRHPGDSRAYVLLGDPGVGKSVMAGALAQRMRKAGHLGAAYFCRHNNSTRNDPRYLLGTVAFQLCDCNAQYKVIVGGEGGVKMLLGNFKLGIQELFTKLLQEPLSKCLPYDQRRLVIIDALDETKYESREDFLDLIMHCFPLLPEWLVFFITSRPEDSVQFRLKKYNPCVKICAGNSDQDKFYQQHEQDIQIFLKKRIDFSRLSVTAEYISKKCDGLFLYAHYIVEELRLSVDSGKELSDLFPGNIDSFFLQNFKRVYDQVGQDIFKKLFGCAIVAPAPLPVSIISYILNREKSNKDKQQVIDAVSQFVVLRTSDQTLTFLHNLIPAWLTDEKKARKFVIDEKVAGKYLKNIFVEILSSLVNEPRPSIDADLEGYVSQVAIRFLCQNGAKDSLEAVFGCLTNYHFIERRMQSGRIEIYHLLDDLRLAAGRLPLEEVWKQELLQEILFAIENNVLVLLECPDLLHSCVRNAPNAVRGTVFIPQMSAPWLDWIVYAFPDANIADMNCFAMSPNRRTVVIAQRQSLSFFDASTVEKVSGPFNISKDVIVSIKHLEFSPDGKFIFFGRLDKWFSVERSCVEDFSQFSGNSHIYQWGVFAPKGQYIVVKRNSLFTRGMCLAETCLFNLLAIWALKEIEQSRDDEMTVSFCLQLLCSESGVHNERFSHRLGVIKYLGQTRDYLDGYNPFCHYCSRLEEVTQSNQEPSLATMRQLVIELYPFIFDFQIWDLQTGMPVLQQLFSQGIQLNPLTYLCHVTCAFSECALKMGCSGIEKAMSFCNIAVVNAFFCRDSFCFRHALELDWELVLDLDEELVLDLDEESVLDLDRELVWSSRRLKEEQSWLLLQVERLEQLLIALRDLKLELKLQLKLDEFLKHVREAKTLNDRLVHDWQWLPRPKKMQLLKEVQRFELKMDQKREGERIMSAGESVWELDLGSVWKSFGRSVWELEWSSRRLEEERSWLLARVGRLERELKAFWDLTQKLTQEQKLMLKLQLEPVWELEKMKFWKHVREAQTLNDRLVRAWQWLPKPKKMQLLKEAQRFELKMDQKRKGERIMSAVLKEFHSEAFKFGVRTDIDKGFQNLVYDVNEEIRICVSPETTWIEAGDVLRMRLLQTGNQDRHFDHHGNPEHIISKLTHFTFTSDDRYFVYSCEGSLHALSLQTGTVLKSVSGCNLIYLTRERRVGYLFRSDTNERAIFLTSLINPFKFTTVSLMKPSRAGKFIGAIFRSSNTVLSVSSDSIITSWETTANKALICKSFLTSSVQLALPVKNCVLSLDGKLIAIHQETKVELYSFADTAGAKKFLNLVYESKCEFTVACFAFSADSTLLLFCIQDSKRFPHFYVWDVHQKVMAASLKSPGLLTIECCCFSLDKRLVILCGDYEIEILEYAKDTCRRLGVERPYHSVKFTQCTVSLDNQILVCCIANRILIYNLLTPNVNSSKQVLRGHLGIIEFCRFLKANRYLISYGVDGMVFLWDISELKAVAFARITQGQEKIVAMAVSPEEDIAVCFTSSDRICMIKLCGLGTAPSLKPLTTPSKGKVETAGTSPQMPRQIASTSAEDGKAESSSSSDSEEDMYYYYLEHDVLEESD